jgi:hypothetical protein
MAGESATSAGMTNHRRRDGRKLVRRRVPAGTAPRERVGSQRGGSMPTGTFTPDAGIPMQDFEYDE